MSHPETIDRFVIVRQVGAGGMGTVFEAIDPQIDRRVALKVLRRDMLAQNPELVERLWVEARAVNSIHHPGVVQISEARLLPDGTGFLVMEFLDGQTLTQRLRQKGGKLPTAQALQIAVQMASTLNAGHRKGIIHRDLKPDNVMIVPDDAVAGGERVKLLDFGIAKIANAAVTSAPLTLDDMGLGTPGYMAPEQMRDAVNASDRSDVYGLASVVFEMLSGRRPHVAPNAAELIVMVLSQEPPLLTSLLPEAPPTLASLLAKMLQREPASERPAMAEALREFVLVQGMCVALSPSPSGPRSTLEPSLYRIDPVPPTTVGSAEMLSAPGRPGGALAAVPPGSQAASLLSPAASTISQMSGQSGSPQTSTKWRRIARWMSVAIATASFVLGAAWWLLRSPTPIPASLGTSKPSSVGGPAVSGVPMTTSTVTSPALSVPAVRVDITANGPSALLPKVTLPPAQVPANPAGALLRLPDAACVQGAGAGLPATVRRNIAWAFRKAEVRLLPGEHLYLFRQGTVGLQFDSDTVPARVGRRQVEDVSRMLRTAIPESLPPGLKGVHVRCSAK